jgi:hypothetical protein
VPIAEINGTQLFLSAVRGRSSSDDARSMSGLMSGSTHLYDTVLLLSIVAAIVAGVWLLWRI